MLPSLAEVTSSSLSQISILFTARSLGSLLGAVGSGRIYDRRRPHTVMTIAIIGIAMFTALTPFSRNLWLLTAFLFLTGIFQGGLNTGGNTLLGWLHGRETGPFMNGLHFFFGLGTAFTPVIIAQIIMVKGALTWTYLLIAITVLPTAIIALLPSPDSPVIEQKQTVKKNDPLVILLISLIFFCYQGASISFSGWIFTYVTKMNLANETNAAYITSVYWGALTVARLISIPLSMRFKPQQILLMDFAGAILSLLIMAVWPKTLVTVIIASAGFGLFMASIYPTTMTLAGRLMPLSGKIVGLFAIGNYAGSMLIPWIIGQYFESTGPRVMTTVLLIDMLLATCVLAAVIWRQKYKAKLVAGTVKG